MSSRECSYPGCERTTRRGSGRCHIHRYADRSGRMMASTPPRPTTSPTAPGGQPVLCAHADDAGIEAHWLLPGETCGRGRRGEARS
jgi:hypothetical protein